MSSQSKQSKTKTSASSLSNYLFPIIPNSEESFVNFLFWHSILLTCTTPLSRMYKDSWDGKLILKTILNYTGIPQFILGRQLVDTYLAYAPSAKTDRAFGPHAFFGLMWLVAAYLHICHRRRFQSKFSKRALGMFALVAFLGHQTCSLRCLIINPMNQHVLNWLMLMSNCSVSTGYFLLGMYALVKKDQNAHKDAMMRCFLYSIEGAGTIRTVGSIMFEFGVGPLICQSKFGGCAARCAFSYFHRLIWIRALTLYYTGVYAKMQGGNGDSWKMYKSYISSFTILIACFLSVFIIAGEEGALDLFEIVLSPYGSQGVAILCALAVCVSTVLYPDSPRLAKLINDKKLSMATTESGSQSVVKEKYGGTIAKPASIAVTRQRVVSAAAA